MNKGNFVGQFIVGQRWFSQMEPELGPGLVVAIDNKTVTLTFPSSEETRRYGQRQAPLQRVRIDEGEKIIIEGNESLIVESVEEKNGLITYYCQGKAISETKITDFQGLHNAQEKFLRGEFVPNDLYNLRYQTLLYNQLLSGATAKGLLGPKVDLLPHQFYVANEVASRPIPRILLADEVGLGKTIEAGLIIHQLIISGRAQRVLIIPPSPLTNQWFIEMLKRFNLSFVVLDSNQQDKSIESGIGQTEFGKKAGVNPFEEHQLVIASLECMATTDESLEMALASEWDLIVVDEAHRLEWNPDEGASAAYEMVEAMAEKSLGLILLTATPEQLGPEGHFARLRLLDPHRYNSYDQFIEENSSYHQMANLAAELLGANKISEANKKVMDHVISEAGGEEKFFGSKFNDKNKDHRQKVLKYLLDHHGTGRVYIRNTRQSIAAEGEFFPKRNAHFYPLESAEGKKDEMSFLREGGLSELSQDLRLAWLLEFLSSRPKKKVLLITRLKKNILKIDDFIRSHTNIKTGLFHSELGLMERDRQAAYFADPSGAQVLLCTEIGSEGRNFQFAQDLILWDLPLDPDLLEQRIGRLDRIGQQKEIFLHIPYHFGSWEEVMMLWYHDGLGAFENCPTGAGQVLDHVGPLLQEALEHPQDFMKEVQGKRKIDELIEKSQYHYSEIQKHLEQGRDRLIEMNSFDHEKAHEILEHLQKIENSSSLGKYLENVFHCLGVHHEDLDPETFFLKPDDNMFIPHFPSLPKNGISATFNRKRALIQDDLTFLSWDHPLVSGIMEVILGQNLGQVTMVQWKKTAPKKEGLLEVFYLLEGVTAGRWELGRYFPPQLLRVVCNHSGATKESIWTKEELDQLVERPSKDQLEQFKKIPRQTLKALVQKTRPMIERKMISIKLSAKKKVTESVDQEIHRLEQLQKQHQFVREDELAFLKKKKEILLEAIEKASPRLDSIRLII